MKYILKRLKEPSTFAGLAAFLASLGLLGLNEQEWSQIFGAVAALSAAAAVLLKERPAETETVEKQTPGPKSAP